MYSAPHPPPPPRLALAPICRLPCAHLPSWQASICLLPCVHLPPALRPSFLLAGIQLLDVNPTSPLAAHVQAPRDVLSAVGDAAVDNDGTVSFRGGSESINITYYVSQQQVGGRLLLLLHPCDGPWSHLPITCPVVRAAAPPAQQGTAAQGGRARAEAHPHTSSPSGLASPLLGISVTHARTAAAASLPLPHTCPSLPPPLRVCRSGTRSR